MSTPALVNQAIIRDKSKSDMETPQSSRLVSGTKFQIGTGTLQQRAHIENIYI